MPFNIVWDEQNPSILRIDISGHNTWQEAYQTFDQAAGFITSKSERVDVIFHQMNAGTIPAGNPIPHFKAGFTRLCKPANAGNIYIVSPKGVPKIAQPFVNIMMRMYKFDQSRVGGNFRDLEEARSQIAKDRAKVQASAV